MTEQPTTTRPRRNKAAADAEATPAAEAPAKPQRVRPEENEVHAERTAKKAKPVPSTPPRKGKVDKKTAAPAVTEKLADSPAIVVEVEGKQRFVFELIKGEETKNYQKFTYPPGCPMVGTVYAPLGTGKVRISLEAAD